MSAVISKYNAIRFVFIFICLYRVHVLFMLFVHIYAYYLVSNSISCSDDGRFT
jgi:hypothetical protein